MNKQYYVYIVTNKHHTVLYTGVTNDLKRRAYEHRTKQGGGFTSRYNCTQLVYYQVAEDINAAIAREKQIPPSFLAKIVSQLSVAGVVQTSRGARGGVSLARPAEDISLLEVIEAIDGPITLNECVIDASSCAFGDECPVHSIWCEAHETLVNRLKSTTFESLANVDSNGRVQ